MRLAGKGTLRDRMGIPKPKPSGKERRQFSRERYELRDGNLFYMGEPIPVPQPVIRAVILERIEQGLWAPEYGSAASISIGDDVARELLSRAATAGPG